MQNFDATGRNIGDAKAIPTGRQFDGLHFQIGDDAGKLDAIRRIREATGKAKQPPPTPEVSATQEATSQESVSIEEPEVDPDDLIEDEPASQDAQAVSKRSLKLEDLDELVFEFDGEELVLSQDDLKKGVGLYRVNNKRSEEIAQERKSFEAEKAAIVAKASQEVNALSDDIANRQERNRQIDELLELAYSKNWVRIDFNNGTHVMVEDLEKEQKANDLAIRRLEKQEEEKRKEIEEQSSEWRERQRKTLEERDPKILGRLTDVASYLERQGFTDKEAQQLIASDARLVIELDKARKYDNAVNSRGEKKKQVQTKVINKSTVSTVSQRSGSSAVDNHINGLKAQLSKESPGSDNYRKTLKEIRIAQMQRR